MEHRFGMDQEKRNESSNSESEARRPLQFARLMLILGIPNFPENISAIFLHNNMRCLL